MSAAITAKVLENRRRVKEWRRANPEKKAEAQRRYREGQKLKRSKLASQMHGPFLPPEEKKKRRLASISAWQKANRDKVRAIHARRIEKRRAYEHANKARTKELRVIWEEKHRDSIRQKAREDRAWRLNNDPQFRIRNALRKRLLNALKWQSTQKRKSALDLLDAPSRISKSILRVSGSLE